VQRLAVTLWIIFLVAVTFIVLAIYQANPQTPPPVPSPRSEIIFRYNYCVTVEEREHMRDIILEALDRGLREHTQNLFIVMMKDPRDQPQRAIAGMNPGVVAYAASRKSLRKWNPPICDEDKK
jgi:hypothetical protein